MAVGSSVLEHVMAWFDFVSVCVPVFKSMYVHRRRKTRVGTGL